MPVCSCARPPLHAVSPFPHSVAASVHLRVRNAGVALNMLGWVVHNSTCSVMVYYINHMRQAGRERGKAVGGRCGCVVEAL